MIGLRYSHAQVAFCISLTLANPSQLLSGSRNKLTFHHARNAACGQAVDILFLQDTTQTFMADLPVLLGQMPEIYSAVQELFPGTRLGVAEFKDKPFFPLGWPDYDYCYQLISQGLTTDLPTLMADYGYLYVSAGGDLPEASYQAIINACYDNRVGWRDFAGPEIDFTKTGARIIVLVTDAVPHFEGDMAKYPQVPQLPKNPGGIWQDQFDEFCATYDYPHFDQVVDAINEQEIALVLVVRNDQQNSFAAWQWFNSYLGQPPDLLTPLLDDPNEFTAALIKVLQWIGDEQCVVPTFPPTTDEVEVTSVAAPASSEEGVTVAQSTDAQLTPVGTAGVITRPSGTTTAAEGLTEHTDQALESTGTAENGEKTTETTCVKKTRRSHDIIINVPVGQKELALNFANLGETDWKNVKIAHPHSH